PRSRSGPARGSRPDHGGARFGRHLAVLRHRPAAAADHGDMNATPIVIFGVPRSGTTLLRTVLNAHPHIAAGPEAPWLGHGPASVMAFHRQLTEGEFSFTRNFGVPAGRVLQRTRELIDGLLTDFAKSQGKRRWAHKTPDDCLFVEF